MKFSPFSGIIVARDALSPFEVNKAYNTTQFSNFHAKGVFKNGGDLILHFSCGASFESPNKGSELTVHLEKTV